MAKKPTMNKFFRKIHYNFIEQNKTGKYLKYAIFVIVLAFTACSSDDNGEVPSLKVVNQSADNKVITTVRLVGYEFDNLSIGIGDSQTFTLSEGMSGGYTDINTSIIYSCGARGWSKNIELNFSNGETTTITVNRCSSVDGCTVVCLN